MNMADIRHDAAAGRFEAAVDGGIAECVYRLQGGVMNIVHTEVPPRAEGRGIAAALEQQIEREFAFAPRVRNDRDRSLLRNRLPEALARLMAPLL